MSNTITNEQYYELVKENTSLQKIIQNLNLEIYDLKQEMNELRKQLKDYSERCSRLEQLWLDQKELNIIQEKRLKHCEETCGQLRVELKELKVELKELKLKIN